MEIEVGEYVRNRYGIAKVVEIENNNGIEVLIFDRNICFLVDKKIGEIKDDRLFNKLALIEGVDIKKTRHSKRIIDLIEIGDIIHTRDGLNEDYYYIYDESFIRAVKKDIEFGSKLIDILTHEQYNQNCYRLEEK